MKLLICCLAASFIAPPIGAAQTRAQQADGGSATDVDLATIRGRLVRSVLPAATAAIQQLQDEAAKDVAAMRPDGTWSDINYKDAARAEWATTKHLERILVMAKAARLDRMNGQANVNLEAKSLLALEWWTDHDYQNPNWWWNQIGVPLLTGEIAGLLGDQLPDAARAKIIAIMNRSDWQRWTGANLTWGVGIQIVRGLLENDPVEIGQGYERMYREIKIVAQPQEGIEQDDSFHQHGVQLYNGGYGLNFANDVGRFVAFSWGTRFQIPDGKMALFSGFLLDGQQWMIRGSTFDYSAVGREITRAGKTAVPTDRIAGPIYPPLGAVYGLGNVIALLAAEPTPRQQELEGFAARLRETPGVPELTGNKQFWCSDFMVHRRVGFYTSVRMLSNRTLNSELVNLEGKKSIHMTDGVNLLYRNGEEYRDIFPVWNWTKLPGTTAIQGSLATGEPNPINLRGTTTFNGGVSDSTYGMAAQDLRRGKLSAKKAWFFFDTGYVALGAGITLEGDVDHDVATDVNQPLLVGDVLSSEAKQPISGTQRYHSSKPVWIYHNHVGYLLAGGTDISLSAGPQTGSWSNIGNGSQERVTLPVFNLWIDHGKAPRGATYEYTVLPNTTPPQLAQMTRHPSFEVLQNTEAIQSVYERTLKLVEIAFRQAGSFTTPLGRVEVDHSCLLLVQKTSTGVAITASNPENLPLTLHVQVAGRAYEAVLPEGNFAGSSVKATEVTSPNH